MADNYGRVVVQIRAISRTNPFKQELIYGTARLAPDTGLIVLDNSTKRLGSIPRRPDEMRWFNPNRILVVKNAERQLLHNESWVLLAANAESPGEISINLFEHIASEINRDNSRRVSESDFRTWRVEPFSKRVKDVKVKTTQRLHDEDSHCARACGTNSSRPRLEGALSIQQVDGGAEESIIPQTLDNDHLAEGEHEHGPNPLYIDREFSVNVEDSLLGDSDRDQESLRHTLGHLAGSPGGSGVETYATESGKQLEDFCQGIATSISSSSEQLEAEATETPSSQTENREMILINSHGTGADAEEWGPEDDGRLNVEDFPVPPEKCEEDDADQSEGFYKASPPRSPAREAQADDTTAANTMQQINIPREENHGSYITMTAEDMTELSNVAGDLQVHSEVSEESTASSDTPGSIAESDDQERAIATNLIMDAKLSNPGEMPKEQSSSDGDSEGSKSKGKRNKRNKKKGRRGSKSRK